MIKRMVCLIAFIMLTVQPQGAFSSEKPISGAEATVTALEGSAQAFMKGKAAGREVRRGDRLGKDVEIRVGERSRIEFRFPDGTVMRLSERSRLAMNELLYSTKTEQKNVKVDLGAGKLWANVKKLMTPDSSVEVRTTNAVAGVRGTVYRVNVDEDKTATVKVYDGSVYVANPPKAPSQASDTPASPPHEVAGPQAVPPPYHEVSREEWTAIVKAMQQITISPQGVPSKPEGFDAKTDADEWVRWNRERDKLVHF